MTTEEDISKAIEVLKRGGVILYPTDTVWGIGCDATRSDAVKRVYEIKRRVDSKALIVLLSRVEDLDRYVDEIPDVAYELIEASVRPITIVYDHGVNLAPELLAADGSVGIRITREKISAELCRRLRRPLVSTSANISGAKGATRFSEISHEILATVDYVMESRREDNSKRYAVAGYKAGFGGIDSSVKEIMNP